MPNKLIVLMIDGVSADYVATERGRLPHLSALIARGTRVERLHSEVLGTSLPGRTSMMTGVTADVSGVYGNKIWDPALGEFRYANPDDIRVPTLPARAKAAGRKVAVMGFGMIRPEDAHLFKAPWWVGAFVQRARDAEPTPVDHAWMRVAMHQTDPAFEVACNAMGVPAHLTTVDFTKPAQAAFFGIMSDLTVADWVGALAVAPDAPDLIVAEYLVTDSFQHDFGYKSDFAHWSIMQADMAVGRIMARLEAAGVADQWNLAIMSDHGHSAVERAINVPVVLPGVTTQCEGGSLLVAPKDADELALVSETLAGFGCEPYPNTCLPPEYREAVKVFVAPAGMSFEDNHPDSTEPLVTPKAISTHGLRPGFAGDDRFAVFAGPNVPAGTAPAADAVQVAPTLAALLGLSLDVYPAPLIFRPLKSTR
jgi:predicted AlkP superfamily pyrophosphatase or phosphodiesterase